MKHAVTPVVTVLATHDQHLEQLVSQTCQRMAPLWPLADLVAVNPYLGYVGEDLLQTEDLLQRRLHAAAIPSWDDLRRCRQEHAVSDADLVAARTEVSLIAGSEPPLAAWIAGMLDLGGTSPSAPRCRSLGAVLAQQSGRDWAGIILEAMGRFLAGRADPGIGRWRMHTEGGLFHTWLAWAGHDRSLGVSGLPGFRRWCAGLPDDHLAVIAATLAHFRLAEQPAAAADYLGRLLGELPGWAGHLRQQAWSSGHDAVGDLPHLLAIRCAYDLGLSQCHPLGAHHLPDLPGPSSAVVQCDRLARLTVLTAWEAAWRRTVSNAIVSGRAPNTRPAVQAVFCIDVRSEPLRRQLEAADPGIETEGFAGFFAMPVAVASGTVDNNVGVQAQCPVLLSPAHRIALPAKPRSSLGRLLGAFRRSGVGGFASMETFGLAQAWPLVRGACGLDGNPISRIQEQAPVHAGDLPESARLALLRGMLKHLGLRQPLARLVVLCGHDSTAANNPQVAALACGACGGHSGAINARLAAQLFNDPALRAALSAAGEVLPADSIAVPAVHDTTTDVVRLLDVAAVPTSHAEDLARLQQALIRASTASRARRAAVLPGLAVGPATQPTHDHLLAALEARSRDWAEVRPEWALADNAAFIAAPRHWTRHADLGGRCFLHSYEAARDADGATLELILVAPVVVASWINLQYYGSIVSPQQFGSGSKTIHNIVAGIGVLAGGGGDLLSGLARESLHDGTQARHRPLRLQVFVADTTARIDQVINRNEHLHQLIDQRWITIIALDTDGNARWRRLPGQGWCKMDHP